EVLSKSFIVQFTNSDPTVVTNPIHQSFLTALRVSFVPYTVQRNYSDVFSGVALSLDAKYVNFTATAFRVRTEVPNAILRHNIALSCMSRGYGFTGDNFDGYNISQPDDDPLNQCLGHGTHVADTFVGIKEGFKGVAYKATLGIYCTFGCKQVTSTAVIMSAFQRALADGMHVLNLSFGSPAGLVTDVLSSASETLTSKSIILVAAAGDNGLSGLWMTSTSAIVNFETMSSEDLPTVTIGKDDGESWVNRINGGETI
ncbi:hypothetical protein IWQ61_010507, partial [Dispira simplex]